MKKLLLLFISLFLISGCGTSPQEKQNNFDGCVIDQMKIHNVDGVNSAVVAGWKQEAEKACRNLLD